LLIFWRRSDDWLALLAAFFLVMTNITPTVSNTTYALALAYPVFALPFSLLSFLGWVSLFGFFLLFPNGRLVPHWMGLILLLVIIYEFLNSFPSTTSPYGYVRAGTMGNQTPRHSEESEPPGICL
jgi:hypothetical protein